MYIYREREREREMNPDVHIPLGQLGNHVQAAATAATTHVTFAALLLIYACMYVCVYMCVYIYIYIYSLLCHVNMLQCIILYYIMICLVSGAKGNRVGTDGSTRAPASGRLGGVGRNGVLGDNMIQV